MLAATEFRIFCLPSLFTLMEGQRLKVFENRVLREVSAPKTEEVAGGWRRLHYRKLRNLYTQQILLR